MVCLSRRLIHCGTRVRFSNFRLGAGGTRFFFFLILQSFEFSSLPSLRFVPCGFLWILYEFSLWMGCFLWLWFRHLLSWQPLRTALCYRTFAFAFLATTFEGLVLALLVQVCFLMYSECLGHLSL